MDGRRMLIGGLAAIALVSSAPLGAVEADATRPRLEVTDQGRGCPGIAGAFVVLLDPQRGVLILSGAPFPGGRPAGEATGGALSVSTERGRWELARVGTAGATQRLWAAAYRLPGTSGIGCVAFDRDLFAAEGDLVSYVRWLVADVYLQLPADERQAFPAFTLSNRRVRLALLQGDKPPVELAGREGATLAFRAEGDARTFLISPYVLDPELPRLALRLAATDQPYWQSAPKQMLGWQAASGDQPCLLGDPRVTISLLGVDAPAAP